MFADTGLEDGSRFGSSGLNTGGGRFNGMASGWEVDTSSGPGAVGMGCSGHTAAPASSLPPGLVILATAGTPGAEMTFYQHPGGGSVFSAGSLTFGGSLGG